MLPAACSPPLIRTTVVPPLCRPLFQPFNLPTLDSLRACSQQTPTSPRSPGLLGVSRFVPCAAKQTKSRRPICPFSGEKKSRRFDNTAQSPLCTVPPPPPFSLVAQTNQAKRNKQVEEGRRGTPQTGGRHTIRCSRALWHAWERRRTGRRTKEGKRGKRNLANTNTNTHPHRQRKQLQKMCLLVVAKHEKKKVSQTLSPPASGPPGANAHLYKVLISRAARWSSAVRYTLAIHPIFSRQIRVLALFPGMVGAAGSARK